MKIVDVNYGTGSRMNNNGEEWVEINKNLPPDLRRKVLEHELNHRSGVSGFFHSPELSPKMWVWMLNNPKSFRNFVPYKDGYWDISLIVFYAIIIGVVILWFLTR